LQFTEGFFCSSIYLAVQLPYEYTTSAKKSIYNGFFFTSWELQNYI